MAEALESLLDAIELQDGLDEVLGEQAEVGLNRGQRGAAEADVPRHPPRDDVTAPRGPFLHFCSVSPDLRPEDVGRIRPPVLRVQVAFPYRVNEHADKHTRECLKQAPASLDPDPPAFYRELFDEQDVDDEVWIPTLAKDPDLVAEGRAGGSALRPWEWMAHPREGEGDEADLLTKRLTYDEDRRRQDRGRPRGRF